MKLPEIEISIKYKGAKKSELRSVTSSKDCADVCREVFDADTIDWVESFIVICLNRAKKVIGWKKISQGGLTGTVADPRVIMTIVVNTPGTTDIIIAHNHPSGSLFPSDADKNITRKIKEAATLFDVQLLDHIILSDSDYFSFCDEGFL